MSLIERLSADLKTAMLSQDSVTVGILRMVLSEAKNAKINKGEELTEAELTQLLRKEAKKREDTATLYRTENYPDRAQQEQSEADLIKTYLPAALDPQIIQDFIQKTATEKNLVGDPSAKGVLMKETMAHFAGQVDGKVVSALVDQTLKA